MKEILIFTRIVFNGIISPFNYIFSIMSGILINYFQSGNLLDFKPYLIIFSLLIFFKSLVRYKERHIHLLKMLPEFISDPVLVINKDGKIIESCGNTKKILASDNIDSLNHLFSNKDVKLIFSKIEKLKGQNKTAVFELYSEYLKKWYQVNVINRKDNNTHLIWMFNINARKSLDYSISSISEFFSYTTDKTKPEIIAKVSEKLPMILLQEGYDAVYIATKDNYGILGGYFNKNKNDMFIKSEYITLHEGKSLINHHGNSKGEIFHWKSEDNQDSDINNYLSGQLKEFIDFEINDFLSFHDENLSIICLNKDLGIFESDIRFLQIIINIARLSFLK